ncbi:glycoside hydrolase superfamily [Dactylonectria macrodidyma]|uniref:beta-glucosidase n=1 Tax=Dactylonectria macrodidyma TaxID=307937 RepID=A0A9P9E397_9HYPO|nr:glycoside hydrolase superfamily [Dactylonectria macrodidyma]
MTGEVDFRTLLGDLSLEEKISLLSGRDFVSTPGVSRVGIPPLKTVDSVNGIRPTDFHGQLSTASFPNTACLGSTWNADLLERLGQQIAQQAKFKHAQVVLGPTINIHRDPSAGRNFECFSEDPLLSGHLGAAVVNGIQSQGVGACPKHFVCNDSETFRHYYNVDASPDGRPLREVYLAAWEQLLKKSNPVAVMAAYNKVNGTYCSENGDLIEKILRKEWGFDGAVMSDWFGTRSTVGSINAGLDLEMPFPFFRAAKLAKAVESGEVSEKTIDTRVEKMLQMRNRTRPSHGEGPETSKITDESNAIARDLAAEGIVLLKNSEKTLPFSISESPKIAVIGEYGQRPILTGGGSASCEAQYRQVPHELLREGHPNPDHVKYASGVRTRVIVPVADSSILRTKNGKEGVDVSYFNDDSAEPLLTEVLEEATIFMLGKYKPGLKIPGSHLEMSTTLTPKTTGTHLLAVRHSGAFTLKVDDVEVLSGATPDITTEQFLFRPIKYETRLDFAMEAGKAYQIHLKMQSRELMIGEPTPYGATLCFEEQYSEEGAIAEAVEIASKADISLIYAGRNQQHESEGFDMDAITLPDNQTALIKAVAAASKKTVLLLHCGNPIDVSDFENSVDAIINMHFPGQEGPAAVVDILTGKTNPSGRLATTWFKTLEDWPSFGHFPSEKKENGDVVIKYEEGLAVGYRASDRENRVRWPFGYGLSYTSFNYEDLQIKVDKSVSPATLNATVNVKNTGSVSGKEVVQVYVSPSSSTQAWRPLRELKGFAKASLEAGESRVITIGMDLDTACRYWDETEKTWKLDAGEYKVGVGSCSASFVI